MNKKRLHIVFSIQAHFVIEQSDIYNADEIELVCLQDSLSIGPVLGLHKKEGREKRSHWLAEVYRNYLTNEIDDMVESDNDLINTLKNSIQYYSQIYLWNGSDVNEILSASRLLYHLDIHSSPPFFAINFLSSSLTTRVGEFIYPKSLNETALDQVAELYNNFRLMEQQEISQMQSFWEKLSSSDAHLRITDGASQIMEGEVDFYDSHIIVHCTNRYQTAIRVVGKTLGHMNAKNIREGMDDSFLEWRLKKLVEEGKLKYRGTTSSMRNYEVKLA